MTQLSVMDLAKQGDPHAIATLINRSLASKGIHAEAVIEAECLKISLQAAQIPNQKAVVTIIHRGMSVLQVTQIKRVKIFTYRSDNHYLAWQHEINLDDGKNQQQPLPEPQTQNPQVTQPQVTQASNLVQDRSKDLVNNPKGVILIQKLSQIQQNLQEYQDIIVRFTDEHIGTVRCLTTLTELIQVISQPSFLFAAIASNPNLRILLDTIAESSQTDENGDQVIANLSILQPGQQWQKAKIRLVTKIFLEPAEPPQERESTAHHHQGITLDLSETKPEPESYGLNEPVIETQVPPQTQPDRPINLDQEASLEEITANSLFDDFQEAVTVSPEPKLINDITESSDFADSLFDDFMESGTSNNSEFINSQISKPDNTDNSEDLEGNLEEDLEEDLFDQFTSSDRPIEQPVSDDVEVSLEAIKSRIPQQNLDKLLRLIAEEEQHKTQPSAIPKQTSDRIPNIDMGATTIERVLGNMETITLNSSDTKANPNFVTLDDLSGDLDSLGF
ncbi:hypothetical protein [Pseudanabaena sp. 'Roaring Creek']|uniref:hypothetical protein n=1 Tax=Pseudanabaena sp. 'Roaring Creek' TaxID=1681830 RepID=UPI000AA3854D|nr:hypothetical protein [Pseudanabaena sp. 'Roaring Creek']